MVCGKPYFGDLGHRFCQGQPKPTEAQLKAVADTKKAAPEKAAEDEPF